MKEWKTVHSYFFGIYLKFNNYIVVVDVIFVAVVWIADLQLLDHTGTCFADAFHPSQLITLTSWAWSRLTTEDLSELHSVGQLCVVCCFLHLGTELHCVRQCGDVIVEQNWQSVFLWEFLWEFGQF